jgi:DNA-binding XRE family transcriptional regulator
MSKKKSKAVLEAAESFRAWRNRMSLSQAQAATLLGYANRSSVCNIEKGEASITEPMRLACEYLEIKMLAPTDMIRKMMALLEGEECV